MLSLSFNANNSNCKIFTVLLNCSLIIFVSFLIDLLDWVSIFLFWFLVSSSFFITVSMHCQCVYSFYCILAKINAFNFWNRFLYLIWYGAIIVCLYNLVIVRSILMWELWLFLLRVVTLRQHPYMELWHHIIILGVVALHHHTWSCGSISYIHTWSCGTT